MANPYIQQSPMVVPEQAQIARQQKLAELLQQQAASPIEANQVVGGRVVPVSWAQGAAKLLQGWGAGRAADRADEMTRQYAEGQKQKRMEVMNQLQSDPSKMVQILMGSDDPALQQMGLQQMIPENVVVGRSLLNKRNGQIVGEDATWKAEQEAARAARQEDLQTRLAEQRAAREEQMALRRELAGQASADRMALAQLAGARQEQKNVPKLPASALKMQQEELDAIGTASSINADLSNIVQQIDSGKLNLGPVNNLMAKAKNAVGASDEQSRNLASFQATIEKMRNDTLRLNKGVQTEGDAQRALNELMTNINDPKVVKQRLAELQKINERAVNLRRMNVDAIRSNFGVDPMDTGAYQNQPSAVGSPAPAKEFQSLPDPAQFNGKRMKAPDGTIIRSNGKQWVKE